MLSRSAALLLVSMSAAACLITGATSCGGDQVDREDAARRRDGPVSTMPGSGGGASSLASDTNSSASGGSSAASSGGASGGSSNQSSGGQSKTGGTGGTSTSSAVAGGRTSDSSSAVVSSTGRKADASVGDAPAGGEVGPLACDDKTSNNRFGVYYYTGSAAQTQDVSMHMALINFTALTTRLTQARVRYWFTDEDADLPNILTMYYTPATLAKITTKFLPASPLRVGADTILEFTFTPQPDAGVSFVETTEFNFAFHKDGYSGTFNQANDYSYDANLTKGFGPNPKITAYIDGQLAWGCEPPVAPAADAGSGSD